jgi:hypothetical protein
MKKTLTLFSLIALAVSISAFSFFPFPGCVEGTDDVAMEQRVLDPFTEIEFNLSGDLTIDQVGADDPRTIAIETNANLMEYITTEVKGGVLIISSSKCIKTNDKFDFKVSLNALTKLSLNGSGDAKSDSKIKSDKISVNINGSGNVKLKAEAQSINVVLKGSGDVDLKGESTDLNIDIMGSGDVDAEGMEVSTATVQIKGSGDCSLNVTNQLDATVKGSGDIQYIGTPQVKKEVYGSGEIGPK